MSPRELENQERVESQPPALDPHLARDLTQPFCLTAWTLFMPPLPGSLPGALCLPTASSEFLGQAGELLPSWAPTYNTA